jgi:hypothetical protein
MSKRVQQDEFDRRRRCRAPTTEDVVKKVKSLTHAVSAVGARTNNPAM